MNTVVPGRTQVYLCPHCGHLQTSELPDLAHYYANVYEINLAAEDDDQLYKMVDGRPLYRADHQAAVLQSKLDLFPGCRVLDYGCAKAPTLRKVVQGNQGIAPFLFDVTDKYVSHWARFPGQPGWATHEVDPAWAGSMDVVLSFYALEHISRLGQALANIKALLKPGGHFYFIVPNVLENVADFVVADHVNHFTAESLHYMLSAQGFDRVEVDAGVHDAAFVVTARLGAGAACAVRQPDAAALAGLEAFARDTAQYWHGVVTRLKAFERAHASAPSAIYGAGFYGNFIASALDSMERVEYFVDQNAHLQGRLCQAREIVSPGALPGHIGRVYVGMNPRTARAAIAAIPEWHQKQADYFFL
ncbi:class I SAM-dependent methyltransferase [Cupriavidus sp. 2TAF22]|uniref:class I SAM-dependent methyltransferase n=1 Tax=unclassified Cupriavidus TaxID=2640874 RepID=UPI003F927537